MHGTAPHQLGRNHRLLLMRCHVGRNGLGFGGDFEMSDTQLPKLPEPAARPYVIGDVYTADQMRAYASEAVRAAISAQGEPFGYFRAEPFGWTDCAKDDEGAIALYTALPAPAKPMTDTWADGVQAAADLLKRMADEMAMERGETDPATGAIQFKSAATREWHASLGELAEEIERLKPTHPAPAAQNEREANATARAFSLATMAAEEFVRCNGLSTGEADEFLMTGADLTDEYATACIEHLKHVGECVAFDCDDGVIVRLGDFTLGSLS